MIRPTLLASLAHQYAVMWQVDLTQHQLDGLEGVLRKVQQEARAEGFACGMNAAAYLARREGAPTVSALIVENRDADPLDGGVWGVPVPCGSCGGTGVE